MDAQAFWNVIGNYNEQTAIAQIILLAAAAITLALSYTNKVKWVAKAALGIVNLFIGIGFFAVYGTEPIQKYFALPLFCLVGILFVYESRHNRDDSLLKPNRLQWLLLLLYLLYPIVSVLCGNSFPQMVTHIMPCPVISLSIAVYAGYQKKNRLLLALLTIWGLTGIKSLIFAAYEDMILLFCGFYGMALLIKEQRLRKTNAKR